VPTVVPNVEKGGKKGFGGVRPKEIWGERGKTLQSFSGPKKGKRSGQKISKKTCNRKQAGKKKDREAISTVSGKKRKKIKISPGGKK